MIQQGEMYTSPESDLVVWIDHIYAETPEYYKVRLSIWNKHNLLYYAQEVKHKLDKRSIAHWQEVA